MCILISYAMQTSTYSLAYVVFKDLLHEVEVCETELCSTKELIKIKDRSSHPDDDEEFDDEQPPNKAWSTINEGESIMSTLHQQIIEYMEHIQEAEMLVLETFSSFSSLEEAMEVIGRELAKTLDSVGEPSLQFTEQCISEIAVSIFLS